MDKSATILSYAVRPRVILHVGALALLALTPLPLVPAIIAALDGDWAFALRCAAILAVFLAIGVFGRSSRPSAPRLNEALTVMAAAFIVPPLAMGWAMAAYDIPLNAALFEAVSGLTTTGLSVLPNPEDLDTTLLFTRAWMQWVGGLGFAVLVLGLMGGAGASAAQRLNEAEPMGDDPMAPLRTRARRTLMVYAVLTFACFLALWLTGPDAGRALLFAMTALATGGFAPHSASAAVLEGWLPKVILIGFSTLGAISFSVYLHALRGKTLGAGLRTNLLSLFIFAAISVAGLSLFMGLAGFDVGQVLAHAPFIAVSAQTNTGFSTMEVSALPPAGLAFLMIAMWIGGNSGSTAGGIKTFRVMILFAMVRLTLQRTSLPPDAVSHLSAAGRRVTGAQLQNVITIALLSIATIFLGWIPFLLAGYGPEALFDITSAVTTTGLSTGVVGPTLEPGLKAVLTVAMILGRVEFIALLVMIWPPTWIGGAPKD
ncbi:MAG: TrkH family potassium uptake protein, partial [Oceanicaulis sp.]